MPQVGNPFFTTKPGSLGLGLYLSKLILNAMFADLTVENPARSGAVVSCKFHITDQIL
ncbi:MAG: hypothetical protein ABII23_06140 [bacterium]